MPSYFSCVQLFSTLLIVACQVPQSMGFSRQKYWSGLSCSPQGDLPDLEMEPTSLMSLALEGGFFTTSATWEAQKSSYICTDILSNRIVYFITDGNSKGCKYDLVPR